MNRENEEIEEAPSENRNTVRTEAHLVYLREGSLSETVKLFIANPPPNEFSAADVVQFADTLYNWLKG